MTSTPTPANEPGAPGRWPLVLCVLVVLGGGVALAVALSQGGPASSPSPGDAADAVAKPLIAPPEVFSIRVRWPGANAEEVDALVATPMAATLGGFEDIDDLKVVSRDGEAVAIATLTRTVRSSQVAQIREGAAQRVATRLPADAEIIVVRGDLTAPPDHLVVLTSDTRPPIALASLAAGPVRARVEALAGVTDVAALGVLAQEVLVTLDPTRLAALGLDVRAVVVAIRRPGAVIGAPGGDPTAADRSGLADLGQAIIGAGEGGAVIRLTDVATVAVGTTHGSGVLRLDGRAAAGLAVHGGPTLTTDAIAAAVQPALPPDVALGWRAGTGTASAPAGLHVSLRLPTAGAEDAILGALARAEEAAGRVPGKRSVLDWNQGPAAATMLVRGDWPDPDALEGAAEALRAALADIPGVKTRVAPLDAHGFSPEPAPLVVALLGSGVEAVGAAASEVADAIEGVAGVRAVWSSQVDRVERVAKIDRDRAAQLGVPIGAVQRTETLGELGIVVAELRDGGERLPVRIIVPPDAVGALTVAGADGAHVPLDSLRETSVKEGPVALERVKRSLRVTLDVDVVGRPVAEVRADVEGRLRALTLPAGVTARIEGAQPRR